ncbi:MAG: magnesium chelatase domain-containing protein [Gemmataceae bacterium]
MDQDVFSLAVSYPEFLGYLGPTNRFSQRPASPEATGLSCIDCPRCGLPVVQSLAVHNIPANLCRKEYWPRLIGHRKDAGAFDLPIAVGILADAGPIKADKVDNFASVGELALDGTVWPSSERRCPLEAHAGDHSTHGAGDKCIACRRSRSRSRRRVVARRGSRRHSRGRWIWSPCRPTDEV